MSGKNDADLFKFPQVVVVEASAGSGKTLALAKRYLELLINPKLSQVPIPLASVLAISCLRSLPWIAFQAPKKRKLF